jgi:hypothetical protein
MWQIGTIQHTSFVLGAGSMIIAYVFLSYKDSVVATSIEKTFRLQSLVEKKRLNIKILLLKR